MSNLYKVVPAIAESIPDARAIIGFRNILEHGYAEPDHNKVYDLAIMHRPELPLAAQEALKRFPAPPSDREGGSGFARARGEKLATEPELTM